MTTTQLEPGAPTTPRRSWWPDRRPVRMWESATSFGLGLLWLALGSLSILTAESYGSNVRFGFLQLAFSVTFIAQAGMLVARPGPDRRQVLLYRASWYATSLPVLLAAYAVWFV